MFHNPWIFYPVEIISLIGLCTMYFFGVVKPNLKRED